MPACKVDDCCKPAKPHKKGYCYAHYMRQYRNGTTDKLTHAKPLIHSGGYRMIPALGHPLAKGSSHAYEHRVVYYDAFGEGPFNCHWCQKPIDWRALNIDHKDDDKQNNALANLVASCFRCNVERGRHKAPIAWRKRSGITALGITRTMSEWSLATGISRAALKWRLNRGWSPDRAMTTVKGNSGPKT